jgi:hypothetical protein
MSRTFIRQDAQIRNSVTYDDAIAPTEAAFETNPANVETDLNNIRSQLHNFLDVQSSNWWADLNVPATLETGAKRGINDLNSDLHLVEKKRVLRDVWKIDDIYPCLDLSIALVNDIKAQYEAHRASAVFHSTADTVNTVTSADATDLATAITLANEIKLDYNNHRDEVGVHPTDDTTNIVTAADATDLDTLITLVNDLRTQYEAHRASAVFHTTADTTNTVGEPAVASTYNVHVLSAAQLPTNTTAAVGAVTTKGTVAAQATTFGTAGLDEVVGDNAVSPKNLMPIVDAVSHLDPILIGGKQVYGLFQTESATDGHTMTGTTPNQAQISFVVRTDGGDDLELVSIPCDQGINFATRERLSFEDLQEQDFLKGVTIEFPAATTVSRQGAYNNQGITPVDLTTNAYLDLEGPGLEWQIRDDLEAILFRVIEGSAGGTSEIEIGADVDTFDVNAALNDFLNGASFDTGAAGTTINIGVTANQIDSGGALTVASGGAGDLTLDAANEMFFDDVNRDTSTFGVPLKFTESAAEWSQLETDFGEVSLADMLHQAFTRSGRVKGCAVVTANIAADTDTIGGTNIDVALPDYSGVDTFVDDVDVFLNGELLRNGADAAANNDVYPGTTPASGHLKFEFPLVAAPGNPDTICMIVWNS